MSALRTRLVWLLAVAPACFHPTYDNPACGTGNQCPADFTCNLATQICERGTPVVRDDAGGEVPGDGAPLDGKAGTVCLGAFVNVCVDPPTQTVTLTGNLDTESSSLCAAYTSTPVVDACVVAGKAIELPAGQSLRVTGKKKLILFAADTITIDGTLDASSTTLIKGPAANLGTCGVPIAPTSSVQGGGGAGGGLQSPGNNGGNTGGGATGGVAAPGISFESLVLRGGCAGSDGAKGNGGSGGVGGHGGGALALIAKDLVSITGVINASGGGGRASTPTGSSGGGGGGGGGSGGVIVLDARAVHVAAGAQCFANGGGGAEGSAAMSGVAGTTSTGPNNPGAGGTAGALNGGDGGNGATRNSGSTGGQMGSGNANNSGGGGGGGGGLGFVVMAGEDLQYSADAVSPVPTMIKR